MIINISDVWSKAAASHSRFLDKLFAEYFLARRRSIGPPSSVELRLEKFLRSHKQLIKSSSCVDFSPAILEFDSSFAGEEFRQARQILNLYFDYDAFSSKEKWRERPWSAYKLCESADYLYCPYCQISPIDTNVGVTSKDRAYRPQLDHLLSKADFPYLALTLGNLIPSCERCNGSAIKGRTDFYHVPHLNPLFDPEAISFELVLRNKSLLGLDMSDKNYKFNLIVDPSYRERGTNAIKTFKIAARYKVLLKEAVAIASRARVESVREQIFRVQLPNIKYSLEDCIGFNPLDNSYKNSAGGKMKKDVFEQWHA
jgi:hypothetical protein